MVDDAGPLGLDAVKAVFDDEKVVSDAGVLLSSWTFALAPVWTWEFQPTSQQVSVREYPCRGHAREFD
jgi:hypothetical protein